jgi:tripartite-type tricarboxylate transporter receptor subunit TctC
LAAPLLATPAFAQAPWPNRPIRILVGFPAGGTTDLLGRIAGQILSEELGQPVVIENRPGAGSNIAAQAVLRSPADGYTLMLGSPGTNAINAHLYSNAGYDPLTDFLPISQIAEVPNLLAAHPSLGVRDVPGLIALARQRRLSYGETSIGGSTHLSAEMFRLMAGIEATHVPYRGSAPMMVDLLPGRVDFGFDNLPTIINHVRSGALVPIGVTSARRSPFAVRAGSRNFVGSSGAGCEACIACHLRLGRPVPPSDDQRWVNRALSGMAASDRAARPISAARICGVSTARASKASPRASTSPRPAPARLNTVVPGRMPRAVVASCTPSRTPTSAGTRFTSTSCAA